MCLCKDDNPTACSAIRNKEPISFNMYNGQESYPVEALLSCPCRCHDDKFYIREAGAQQITARWLLHRAGRLPAAT